MITENLKKLLFILMLAGISAWILFNPHVYYYNSEFINGFSALVNDFCKNIGLKYHFSNNDILSALRFFEYFIFGIFSGVLYKLYFNKIWANITNPLFLGLAIPTAEVYLRSFGVHGLAIQDIPVAFFEFCAGLIIVLIFRTPRNKKIFSSKYKKNKYSARS